MQTWQNKSTITCTGSGATEHTMTNNNSNFVILENVFARSETKQQDCLVSKKKKYTVKPNISVKLKLYLYCCCIDYEHLMRFHGAMVCCTKHNNNKSDTRDKKIPSTNTTGQHNARWIRCRMTQKMCTGIRKQRSWNGVRRTVWG